MSTIKLELHVSSNDRIVTMYHDDQQYNKSRFMALAWMQKLNDILPSPVQDVGQKLGAEGVEYEFLALGSFNSCYRLKGLHSIIRFPIMCKSAFRYEKTNDECQVMAYISRFTSIPVPKLLTAESCDLGPYKVMSIVDGTRLPDSLKAPQNEEAQDQGPVLLNPSINTAVLTRAYRSMISVLIKLSMRRCSKIGAIGQNASGDWDVTKRAITLNMNQLVSCGNFPPKALPQQPFSTANAYFTALAEMHITQSSDTTQRRC